MATSGGQRTNSGNSGQMSDGQKMGGMSSGMSSGQMSGNWTQQSQGQPNTGIPNHIYDLTSVLYHCTHESAKFQQYINDAQQAGSSDLAQFFQQCQQEDRQRAMKAQQLLGQQWSSVQTAH